MYSAPEPNRPSPEEAIVVGAEDTRDSKNDLPLPGVPGADLVKIREWLQPTPFDQEKGEYARHRTSHLMGTGQWLTSSAVYQQWHSGESGLLWIKGIPGSGKSVMAASIIDQLQKEEVPVLYFFFRQIIDANHRPVAALRDWLYQALSYSPPLQIELKRYLKERRALDSVSLDDLLKLLKIALGALPKVYCITDALDEMDQGNDDFLHSLVELGQWRPSNLKVLITSRPVATIESSLRQFNIPQARLEERLVDADIAAFVQYKLQRSSVPREQWKTIEQAIPGRANGLFLYAKLSMDAFLEPGADPNEVLKALPADLNTMYDDLLRNHAKRYDVPADIQLLVLQSVTHATRPLRLLEMTEMINAVHNLDTPGERTSKQTKERIRTTCGPLIEILPDETVSVIHHSLTEFLKGLTRTGETTSLYPVLQPGPTNQNLAMACLKYLRNGCLDKHEVKKRSELSLYNNSKKAEQAGLRLSNPFIEYAAENWPTHASRTANAGADMTSFYTMLDEFFAETQRCNAWLDIAWPNSSIENVNPLHVAAFTGLEHYAAHLLEKGEIDIESRGKDQNTPVYWAASAGHADVVRLLLENGAEADASGEEGLKPLHRAASKNHPKVVRVLLEAGVDPLTRKTADSPGRKCGNAPTSYGHTPLMYACRNGHAEVVAEFVPFLDAEASGRALSWAAGRGRANIVELLLKHPEVDVNGKYRGDTALFKACQFGDSKTIEVLLRGSADPNVICTKSGDEFGGIGSISRGGFDADHRKRDKPRGYTALFVFCGGNPTLEGMELLLSAGADVHMKTFDGHTALHHACTNTSAFSIITSLLDAGADATAETDDGSTPLHTDGKTDKKLLPILLSTKSVDINKARSTDGKTPLHCRLDRFSSDDSALHFLAYKPEVNVADAKGNSVLHDAVKLYRVKPEFILALLSAGANPNARNRKGETPLHCAASGVEPEIFRALVKAGADVEARDHTGQTPLFKHMKCAGLDGRPSGFETLIDLGARADARDYKGQTLLHHGCQDIDRVDYLIQLGLSPHVTDHGGNTVLHTAASMDNSSARGKALEHFVGLGLDIDQPSHRGRSVLHILCSEARKEESLDYAIGVSKQLSISDIDGIQPLHLAAAISEAYVFKLLKAGADLFGVTHEGMTVLHIAARARQSNIIGIVLAMALQGDKARRVAFVNQTNEAGQSALHYACSSGRPESVKALLVAGADPNLEDKTRVSPFVACIHFEAEKALWKNDADGQSVDEVEGVAMLINDKRRPRLAKGNDTTRLEEIFELLLFHGSMVTGEHGCFKKALLSALSGQNDYTVKCLLRLQARLTIGEPLSGLPFNSNYLICTYRLEALKRALLERFRITREGGLTEYQEQAMRQSLMKSSLAKRQFETFEEIAVEEPTWPAEIDNRTGTSILHHLASCGFFDLLFRLCSRETALEFDDPDCYWKLKATPDRSRIFVKSLLITACDRQLPNMNVVRHLVENLGVDLNARNKTHTYHHGSYQSIFTSGALHHLASGHCWWHVDEALPYLIKKGANIELRDEDGLTPLQFALHNDRSSGPFYKEAVKLLIDSGADVNTVDDEGKTCLSMAGDDLVLIKELIANGAQVSAAAVLRAIELMQVEVLEVLLSQDDVANLRRPGPTTPRAGFGDERIAESEMFPLLYAASQREPPYNPIPDFESRQKRIIALLLSHGANPYATFVYHISTSKAGRFRSVKEETQWRLRGATVIHEVLATTLCADHILSLPSLDLEARDAKGRTLLLAASKSHYTNDDQKGTKTLQDLIDRGADVMAQDNKGKTILHHLKINGGDESTLAGTMRGVIAKSPDLVHLGDEAGDTPLHYALRSEDTGYVDFLLEIGSDRLRRDSNGDTMLHLLMRSFDNHRRLKDLLNAGIDINSQNKQGDTPLFKYVHDNISRRMDDPFFDEYCSDPEDEEFTDPTFLFFQDEGADFFARNNAGSSLLHLLAGIKVNKRYGGKIAMKTLSDRFKFLMQLGLDPMAEDAQLRTSLDVAAACGSEHILKIFERKPME